MGLKLRDSFYRCLTSEQLEKVHEHNFDHPDAFDTELLLLSIEKLQRGQAVTIHNYDFKSHTYVEPAHKVNPSDVIILQGILLLHDPRVRDFMNMKIFVDTDSDVRLARRIQRDTVNRARNIENVLDQYTKFVKPSFDDFILPSKKYADVLIPRGADNEVAIDLIVQHIRTKLGQHDLCKIYPNVYVTNSTFQVFEGHSGTDAASFIRKNILNFIVEESNFPLCLEKAVKKAFVKADHDVSENTSLDVFSGTNRSYCSLLSF